MNSLQRILKNALALSVTGGMRTLFGLIIQVLIARSLGVEGLGKFGIMTSYVAIFQVVAQVGLPNLLVREVARHREEIPRFLWSGLAVFLTTALAAWAALALVATLLGHPADTYRMVLIAGGSLLPYAAVIASESVLRGVEQMEVIPAVQTVAYTVYLVSTLAVLVTGWSVVALGWTQVAMQATGAVLYLGYLGYRRMIARPRVDLSLSRRLVHQAPHFYVLSLAAIMPDRLGIIIVGKVLGEQASGIFNAAQLFVRALQFVMVGYVEALYPAFSRVFAFQRESFAASTRAGIRYGLVLSAGMVLFLVGWAPLLVGIFRDAEYRAAVPLLWVLAWHLVLFTLAGVLNSALMAANRQDLSMYIALVKVITFVLALVAFTLWWGLMGAVLGVLTSLSVALALSARAVHRVTRGVPPPGMWARAVLAAALGMATILVTRGTAVPVGGVLSLAAYGLALWALGVITRADAITAGHLLRRSAPIAQQEV